MSRASWLNKYETFYLSLIKCWYTVCSAGPTINQHRLYYICILNNSTMAVLLRNDKKWQEMTKTKYYIDGKKHIITVGPLLYMTNL